MVTRFSSERQADMISRQMVCSSVSPIGPGLRSATPRSTCASRSGRNTGALVSALTWPTCCATLARWFSRSRICASMASICSRKGVSLSFMGLLSVAGGEFVQVVYERLHALDRHRVVDRCTHTADGLVALQLQQAARFGAGQECFILILVLQVEGNVHARAAGFRYAGLVKIAGVERVVQQPGLGDGALLHLGHSALLLQPLEHQAGDIDAIG